MQLFYTPDINSQEYTLSKEESNHCVRVLRKTKGDILHLTDGKGSIYKAEVVISDIKACQLSVVEVLKDFGKKNFFLHMAVAPTKNTERFEWFLEKATEIGIDEITPLISERSERKVIKQERLERIIISAMKQSEKAFKPQLNRLITFNEFLSQQQKENFSFIAHCNNGEKAYIQHKYKQGSSCLVLIGPEGDFTKEEVELAISKKYVPVSLGHSRLRTETAALVACNTINLLNQK